MTSECVSSRMPHRSRRSQLSNSSLLLITAVVAAAASLCAANPAWAQATDFRVIEGHSRVLRHKEKIKTVSVANDSIADVVAITSDELVVIGKRAGNTTLIVFGEFSPYVTHNIIVDRNFSGQQIMLEVQIGEVNRTSLKELGFDFGWINNDDDFITPGEKTLGTFGGQTQVPKIL